MLIRLSYVVNPSVVRPESALFKKGSASNGDVSTVDIIRITHGIAALGVQQRRPPDGYKLHQRELWLLPTTKCPVLFCDRRQVECYNKTSNA